MDLPTTIHTIGAHDHKLAMRELKPLSSLAASQRGEFWPAWQGVQPRRRAEITRAMAELAEENVDLDFAQAQLWLTEDDDAEVRALAAEGLWESEQPAVVRRLLTLLRTDPAAAVRAAAAQSLGGAAYRAELGELDEQDARRIEADLLATILDQRQPLEVRRRAIESAGFFANQPEVQQQVGLAYAADEQMLRESALVAMGRSMLPRWLPTIAEALGNPSPALRYEAARAAGEMSDDAKPLLPKLSPLLNDPDTEVALAAIWALGQIGGESASRLLKQIAKDGQSTRKQAAIDALEELGDGLIG